MKLEKDYKTPSEELEDYLIANERAQAAWDEVQNNFPNTDCKPTLSIDTSFGTLLTRAFIKCPKDISEKDTRIIIKWLKRYFGNAERNFRERDGYFFWISKCQRTDANGLEYELMILVEQTNPLTCEIKKIKKEVEVYESICK